MYYNMKKNKNIFFIFTLISILLILFLIIIILLSISLYKSKRELKYVNKHYLNLIFDILNKQNEKFPRNIYCYWHSSKLPFFVEKCYQNIKAKNKNYQVFLFNENMLEHISEFPEFFKNKSQPIKTDWLRLFLLQKYGGVWIDISCIFIHNTINNIINHNIHDKLFGYKVSQDINIIETWFLASSKNNIIVSKWLDEFVISIKNNETYIKNKLPSNQKYWPDNFNKKLHLDYHRIYLCFNVIKKDNSYLEHYIKYLGNAKDYPNPIYFMEKVDQLLSANDNKIRNMKFIKFIKQDRNAMIKIINSNNYNKNSLLMKSLFLS